MHAPLGVFLLRAIDPFSLLIRRSSDHHHTFHESQSGSGPVATIAMSIAMCRKIFLFSFSSSFVVLGSRVELSAYTRTRKMGRLESGEVNHTCQMNPLRHVDPIGRAYIIRLY